MFELILTVGFGLLGGVAVGTTTPIAGAMSQRVGGAESSFIVHLGGAVASLALIFARRGESIAQWRELPWYMLGCGALGLVLYLSVTHTLPKLGATAAVTLIIVGQLLAGLLIDHIGAFGAIPREINPARVVGIIFVLAGAFILVKQ